MSLLRRTAWLLYQLLIAAGMALAAPYFLVRRGRHYLATLAGRLGSHPPGSPQPGTVWIHAVSVGEVSVAATLAGELPALPMVVTTVTPTGQERARALFAGRRRTAVTYLPFDLGFAVSAFFRRFEPAALILVEGDYWPLVLETARRRGVPTAVVNGRVGERSAGRLARIPRLGRKLFFRAVDRFCVQTEEDRRRLLEGGAEDERIHVTGNLKFDAPAPAPKPEIETAARRLAAGRPILLAGSTMAGEDEAVLDAFRRLGAGERALLLIAPRHPERFDGVARLIDSEGFAGLRRSALGESDPDAAVDVLLLDTLGELAALYRIADAAFIGGTLVPTGGHNPLEPACFAVPIAVGPSMENFREMAESFDRAEAWARVADARELADRWRAWLADPQAGRAVGERAAELLSSNRGALERTVALLEPLLPKTERATS